MTELLPTLPYLIGGIIAVTVLAIAGAWASRVLNFSYAFLIVFSFLVYGYISYAISPKYGVRIAVLINVILAFYDATVGWKLSSAMKPKTGLTKEQLASMTLSRNLTAVLVAALLFTFVGSAFS